MRKRLFWSFVGFSVAVTLVMSLLTMAGMALVLDRQLRENLQGRARTLSSLMEGQEDPVKFLAGGDYADRVTLVDENGKVLFDSVGSAQKMESHSGREEIMQAISRGEGWSARDSQTLGEQSVYYARRLENGKILRVSGTRKSTFSLLKSISGWLLAGAALCAVLASRAASPLTRSLVKPINEVSLDQPLQSDAYEELSPILRRMDAQNRRIHEQMRHMRSQQAELETILHGMREGLMVLDENRRVLAMNQSAREALHFGDGDITDQTLLQVCRNEALLTLVREGTGSAEICDGGKIYRAYASGVRESGGLVLLLQDVTGERDAEERRRQFTANVSHELRTPLTVIAGYAEMLEQGMAGQSDAAALGGKIHAESRRMLQLIGDILRLSRLDEGVCGEFRDVDLLKVAERCRDKLETLAKAQRVTVTVGGESVCVHGDEGLLEEMLTNLMENGVKYNHPGGSVTVHTGTQDQGAYVSVGDTGVGIAQEEQDKVFERFYRVDKSRSKATGGTGLGLSIVKHGAQIHGAAISLNSTLGVGTTIRLTWPADQ